MKPLKTVVNGNREAFDIRYLCGHIDTLNQTRTSAKVRARVRRMMAGWNCHQCHHRQRAFGADAA